MTSRLLGSRALASIGAAAGLLLLTACAPLEQSKPNEIRQRADAMVGQPVSAAYKVFGLPSRKLGPSSYGSGGFYNWDRTKVRVGPGMNFVQTGTEYTGRQIIGMTQGGKGIASSPVYQDNYRPTGHYEQEKIVEYVCDILVLTDQRDIITKVNVAGCG